MRKFGRQENGFNQIRKDWIETKSPRNIGQPTILVFQESFTTLIQSL